MRRFWFQRHVGMVVVFFHAMDRGWMCRRCALDACRRASLFTAILGWWGCLSAVLTPVSLVVNLVFLIQALTLSPEHPPEVAGTDAPPQPDPAIVGTGPWETHTAPPAPNPISPPAPSTWHWPGSGQTLRSPHDPSGPGPAGDATCGS